MRRSMLFLRNIFFFNFIPAIPHKCDVCGKEFKLRQNLNNHIRTHTGQINYFFYRI